MLTRRQFLTVSVAGSAAAVTGVSAHPRAPQLRQTFHSVYWPVRRRLTIAHLTDLHVGWGAPWALLERAALQCRLTRPDLTVLTGDYFIDSLRYLERFRELVRRLPRPCIATLGNHDYRAGAEAVQSALAEEGIQVLRNERLRLSLCRTPRQESTALIVVGIDDACSHHDDVDRAMGSLQRGQRALVLTHDPRVVDQISRHGDHLVLAGHTHGGQIYVPWLSPAVARLKHHRYLAGWYSVAGTRLYVNVGLGCSSLRQRLGARAQPEIAVIELLSATGRSRQSEMMT